LSFWSTPRKANLPETTEVNADVKVVDAVVTAHAEAEAAVPEVPVETPPEDEARQEDSDGNK
jgi:hypothetical protein